MLKLNCYFMLAVFLTSLSVQGSHYREKRRRVRLYHDFQSKRMCMLMAYEHLGERKWDDVFPHYNPPSQRSADRTEVYEPFTPNELAKDLWQHTRDRSEILKIFEVLLRDDDDLDYFLKKCPYADDMLADEELRLFEPKARALARVNLLKALNRILGFKKSNIYFTANQTKFIQNKLAPTLGNLIYSTEYWKVAHEASYVLASLGGLSKPQIARFVGNLKAKDPHLPRAALVLSLIPKMASAEQRKKLISLLSADLSPFNKGRVALAVARMQETLGYPYDEFLMKNTKNFMDGVMFGKHSAPLASILGELIVAFVKSGEKSPESLVPYMKDFSLWLEWPETSDYAKQAFLALPRSQRKEIIDLIKLPILHEREDKQEFEKIRKFSRRFIYDAGYAAFTNKYQILKKLNALNENYVAPERRLIERHLDGEKTDPKLLQRAVNLVSVVGDLGIPTLHAIASKLEAPSEAVRTRALIVLERIAMNNPALEDPYVKKRVQKLAQDKNQKIRKLAEEVLDKNEARKRLQGGPNPGYKRKNIRFTWPSNYEEEPFIGIR